MKTVHPKSGRKRVRSKRAERRREWAEYKAAQDKKARFESMKERLAELND